MSCEAPFRHFGTMIDCSRNAVMNIDSVKRWIDITSDLGFNTLMLYTEDTYEVKNNPYFGYGRGRYSVEELKELDRYAAKKNTELIPCIQTLAHLNAITRWPNYKPIIDTEDILLAGDDRVYDLIENIFSTLAECFTSRTVNIGMDEAHMIGRGKYYDIHGDSDRSQVLINHIKRVAQIGAKYGFTLCMWSDMFYRLVVGDYYDSKAKINDEIKRQIPDNVRLVYWDYYSTDKSHYNNMMKSHAKIKEDTWFAGGIWSWTGFAPHNIFSMNASKAALISCKKNGIQDVFFTLWGDNGGECSKFSLLPALFYISEIAKGNTSKTDIKKRFHDKYGIAFDRFAQLDLTDVLGKGFVNPEKYLLYNDPFTGLFDSALTGNEAQGFALCGRKLKMLKNNKDWGYLFASEQALCEVLSIKADLGVKTRTAYEAFKSGDKTPLCELIPVYKKLIKKLEAFYEAYRTQWFTDNKPCGFDVQDIRIGGLIMRVKHCMRRLSELCEGKISVIDELEEKQLDVCGAGETFGHQNIVYNNWGETATANVL